MARPVVAWHDRENRFNPYGPYNRCARYVRHNRSCRVGSKGGAPVGALPVGLFWGDVGVRGNNSGTMRLGAVVLTTLLCCTALNAKAAAGDAGSTILEPAVW